MNNLKKVEEGIVPIYENEYQERLIDARELFYVLRGENTKTKFSDWIKQRLLKYQFVENIDYIRFRNFTKGDEKGYGNKVQTNYYVTIDTGKELCMIENNRTGRQMRMYFIEIEKRYRQIINNPQNMFDIMHITLNQIEANEKRLSMIENKSNKNTEEIENIKRKIDIKIQNNYCLASDIAEQLNLYSENKIPHSNLIGAIARELGYKISYKHYYEDDYIAIIKDISKNEYWQVYFKPKAVEEITEWFSKNKEEIYYEIQYVRNTKKGKRGEIKEKGYKIENICYKIF